MISWQPDISRFSGPLYLAIADALAEDIRTHRLEPGMRLPTHRDLAYRLKVTVGTVTRAYAEAERRGLIGGEVGRGTYVRADLRRLAQIPPRAANTAAPATEDGSFVDFSINLPASQIDDSLLATTLEKIAGRPGLLDYHHHAGLMRHRRSGADWLAQFGHDVAPERVLVTAGAQHAMTAALGAITEPGDIVLCEYLTYPGLKRLADFLRLRLIGLPMDAAGIDPEAFDLACQRHRPKALYCVNNMQNPTGLVVPMERRQALADIARRHGIKIVEDDVYGFLLGDLAPPPLSRLAPELGHYLTSVSKSMSPGLRVGYLAIPEGAIDSFALILRSTTWMAAPLTAEIAAEWIADGTGRQLAERHRRQAAQRQQQARALLSDAEFSGHPASFHLWLNLPEPWSADLFSLAAQREGIGVSPAGSFAISRQAPAAIRLCLSAPRAEADFLSGLERIGNLLKRSPSDFGTFI